MFNNEGGSLTSPHCLWVTKHPPHRKDWAHCASWLPLTMYAHYDGLFPTVTLCVGWVLKCQLCIWNFTDFFFFTAIWGLESLVLGKIEEGECRRNKLHGTALFPKVWSPEKQRQHHLGTCHKHRCLGPTPNQTSWIRSSGSRVQKCVCPRPSRWG